MLILSWPYTLDQRPSKIVGQEISGIDWQPNVEVGLSAVPPQQMLGETLVGMFGVDWKIKSGDWWRLLSS